MKRRVRFAEEADAEFAAAVRWFEEKREGFGATFFDAVQDALDLVRDHPQAGSSEFDRPELEVRRIMIRRFRYQLVYHVRSDEIVVVAVAHTSRRPGYWMHRL